MVIAGVWMDYAVPLAEQRWRESEAKATPNRSHERTNVVGVRLRKDPFTSSCFHLSLSPSTTFSLVHCVRNGSTPLTEHCVWVCVCGSACACMWVCERGCACKWVCVVFCWHCLFFLFLLFPSQLPPSDENKIEGGSVGRREKTR